MNAAELFGPRVRLRPLTQAHRDAFARGREVLAAQLNLRLPDGWPAFPEGLTSTGPEVAGPWVGYLFVAPDRGELLGNGGYKGPPDADGVVEIGYEIGPPHRNQGWATEVVRVMVERAFAAPEVRGVCAHTLATPNASNRVLQKVGFTFAASIPDADLGSIWRWTLRR